MSRPQKLVDGVLVDLTDEEIAALELEREAHQAPGEPEPEQSGGEDEHEDVEAEANSDRESQRNKHKGPHHGSHRTKRR